MDPERWQNVERIYHAALQREESERSLYLEQACTGDSALRAEVESLMKYAQRPGKFLNSPALEVAAQALAETLRAEGGTHPDRMIGAGIEQYRIIGKLGAGGMGEVYRARDSRLGRDVAIKILPSFLSTDSDRLRRFEQEARAAAALNHPNILAVYEMGTYEGAPYLVSELLEGETLRELIKRGRLSVRKAIDYGVQIAHGLAAAHEKGIVHRDLKPENLFVTKDGRVKILDFGLAKLTQPQSDSEHSAPMLAEGTEAGVVMGTVGYMAPEQVRGQTADHRADIFAFASILYEMLTGTRAFQRATSADTMSAILNEDPPGISEVTTNIPPAMQRVVHRCLEKNPEQRFQSASDLAFALDALSQTSSSAAASSNQQTRKRSELWAIAALLAVVVPVALVVRSRSPRPPEHKHALIERQLTANPSENTASWAAISRDGKYLAYGDLANKLYLLAIDSGDIRESPSPLPAGYELDDWFPDGNHLLFHGGGAVWKISTLDFSKRKLWGSEDGGLVSPDGSQVAFVEDTNDSEDIWLMGADGEEPRRILTSELGSLRALAWSPAGQRLAYVRLRGTLAKPERTIETCDLAGGAHTVVLSDPHIYNGRFFYGIAWLPDARIFYPVLSESGDAELWTIRADPSTGQQRGDATRLTNWKNFHAIPGGASADGKRLIVGRQRDETGIYVGDLAVGSKVFTPQRFTPDDWYNAVTDWTKDSKAILFHSNRNGRWAIFKQDIDAKTPEPLIAGSENYFQPKLSAQGALLYMATASSNRIDPSDTTIRLMSTPEQGGARSTLLMGKYNYGCGSSPSSSCVASELKDGQLSFFHLDPVKGRGEEIGRIGYKAPDARWDLSPDGTRLAIVDNYEEKAEIRILNLADRMVTVLPVRDWKWNTLQQISWTADGKSWFAYTNSDSYSALLSIDASGNPKILQKIPAGYVSSIVPSPDGKRLAFTKMVYAIDVMLLENF